MDEKNLGLTIKAVSELTGVSVQTLRAWERRYGIPSPSRGATNRYRLYSDQDIANVLFLKRQVEAGVSPSQASALMRQSQKQPAALAVTEVNQPISAMQVSLLDAFARSDEMAARQVLDQAFAMFAPERVALQIVEPTMREIGARWLHNEMSVWQEHLASNVVQQKLFVMMQAQPVLPSVLPHLVAAGAPAELPPPGQDVMQMSGTFIIGTDGRIRLPYYYENIVDHAPIDLLLNGVLATSWNKPFGGALG